MDHTYRHTQVGWVVYAVGIPLVLFVFTRDAGSAGVVAVVMAIVFLVFGWLTVEIDRSRMLVRFGIGLVRRRIRLDTIRAFARVRNPWYYGWGIRLTPHGVLYNVSGLDAVELLLDDGRRVRVGTDEADGLVRALQQATRVQASRSTDEFPKDAAWRRRARLITVTIVVLVFVFIGGQMYVYSQEPSTTLEEGTFSVGVGFHGRQIPFSAIESATLEDSLPGIEARTNGFAAGGLLRGQFRLDQWGAGQLFINRHTAPFLVVRTAGSFVVVNFDDPARTRALHDRLRQAMAR